MTTDSNETTLAGITGIRTVGVPVTNQDLAVEFYVEKLGSQRRRRHRPSRRTARLAAAMSWTVWVMVCRAQAVIWRLVWT